jgi:hypothetical protein
VLALLVALLSVSTVAGPVFRDLFITKDSELVASFQELNNEEATFVVSNSGNRPGTVGEAFVIVARSGQTWPDFISLPRARDFKSYEEEKESSFVDAGKSRFVRYVPRASDRYFNIFSTEIEKRQCAFRIDLINFSGRRESPCFQHSCVQIHNTLFREQGVVSLLEVPSQDRGSENFLDRCERRR